MDEDAIRRELIASGGIWQAPLVDRIDRIVCFRPLHEQTLREILQLQIEDRSSGSVHPLPPELGLPEVQQTIVEWATGGRAGSARRLERALVKWLVEYSQKNGGGLLAHASDRVAGVVEEREKGID
jgi:ATP-dependent Clp protease ATP-binding subunit ClpA